MDTKNKMELIKTTVEDTFNSDTAQQIMELINEQYLQALSKTSELEFNPYEDDTMFKNIVQSAYKKLTSLLELDVEELLDNEIQELTDVQQAKVKSKDGNLIPITIKNIPNKSKVTRTRDSLLLESQIASTVKVYAGIIENFTKERRMLNGQLYGSQNNQGQSLNRVTKVRKIIMDADQFLLKSSSEYQPPNSAQQRMPALTLEQVGVTKIDLNKVKKHADIEISKSQKPAQEEDSLESDTYEDD